MGTRSLILAALLLVACSGDRVTVDGGEQTGEDTRPVEYGESLPPTGQRNLRGPSATPSAVEILWKPAHGYQWRVHRASDGPLVTTERFIAMRFRSGALVSQAVAIQFSGYDWCGLIDVPQQPSAVVRVTYGTAPGTFPIDADRFELNATNTYEVVNVDESVWLSVELMPRQGGEYGAPSSWFEIRWQRPTSDDDPTD